MSMNTLAVEAAADKKAVPRPPSRDDNVAGLTKYIPTESITLYIATVSAQKTLSTLVPWLTPTKSYWLFVGLTPLLMLAIFLRKLA